MSKEDTKSIQGLAVLMMLFLHLFNGNGITDNFLVNRGGGSAMMIMSLETGCVVLNC